MVANRIFEYLDLDEQTDAEYWRNMLIDEVRVGRKERWAAMFFGFGCGLLVMLVIAVAVS